MQFVLCRCRHSLYILETFVDEFEREDLTLHRLPQAIEMLYQMISDYYSTLPSALRVLETYDEHARLIASNEEPFEVEDHGWDELIPMSS